MMTPTIRVDDDVFAALQREARPFIDTPNSMLRKLVGLEETGGGSTATPPSSPAPGRLQQLLQEGHLKDHEVLIWPRRQHGQTFRATVTEGGGIRLEDGRHFDSPSGAARELAGYEVNGWRTWRRESDGATLEELRERRMAAIKRRIDLNRMDGQAKTGGDGSEGSRP